MDKIIITKDNILQHTTQEEIFKSFLKVNELPKGNVSSPFTEDKKPSFKVYSNGSFKCNSTGKQGDVFQFVADINNLDCKTQFNEILNLIAKEMNIPLQTNCKSATNTQNSSNIIKTPIKPTFAKPLQSKNKDLVEPFANEKTSSKLSIEKRDFTELDLQYWNNLGVTKDILQNYNCNSVSSYLWTGKKPIYTKKEAVAFAWELQNNFKLYIPNQPNINVAKNVLPPFAKGIFGLEQLGAEKKESIIICEGEKDVVVAVSKGFNAVTFGSGAVHVAKEKIEQLQSLCKNLFVCYDTDNTGITGMDNLTKSYPFIIPLYLPANEKIKGYDITDYFQGHKAQDFQKIIDLAVKNKSIVEVSENTLQNDFSEYDFPKEIKDPINKFIDDIKKYQLFMANNKIWVLKGTERKKYFKDVSNFEIEVLQHMQDEKFSLKLIRIKNIHNKEIVFDVLSDRLNTVSKLDETVTSFGNFLFTGNTNELNLLRAYLFDKMGIGKKIDCLGLQEEYGFWIWNNKVNLMNGETLNIDKNGMFKYKDNSFYVPSANEIYKFNNSKFINQKKFKVLKSETSIENYINLWYRVYKEHSIPSMLFTLSSVFQDIVVNETKSFPILFLQGGASSGKDNLAHCCQSFLGIPQDKISIGAGVSTHKAQIRELAQFTNGISQFSEYKPGDKTIDEILKGIWDRNGYKMGTIESKVSTDVVPICSSLIVTSNYTPIDEPLITRFIWVNIEKNTFTQEESVLYQELKDITDIGISSLTDELLNYKSEFKKEFKDLFVKNKDLFTANFGILPARVASNYAVLKTTFDFFSKIFKFPFNEYEIIQLFNKNARFIGDKINTSSISVKWWDCFYECLKTSFENKIQLDIDYRLDGNNISFNYSAIYGKIQRQWYNQFKENIPSKDTIKSSIENHISFAGKKESCRLNEKTTSVMIFDTSLLENSEIFIEYFNYTLNKTAS